jgi:hypothetical protein
VSLVVSTRRNGGTISIAGPADDSSIGIERSGCAPTVNSGFTSKPVTPAPQLRCPTCHFPLIYRLTVYEKSSERSDYLECRTCGPFEYDHRAAVLRAVLS